jgi:hypothetical protein
MKKASISLSSLLYLFLVATPGVGQLQVNPKAQTPLLETSRTDTTLFPRYKISTYGIGSATIRDPAISPLRYQGLVLYFGSDKLKYKPRFFTIGSLEFKLSLSPIENNFTKNTVQEIDFRYTYAMLKPIRVSSGSFSLYTGGYGGLLLNQRIAINNVNNVISYDYVVSFGITGLAQKKIKIGNSELMLTEQLSLPLLSVTMRPPYAWPEPYYLKAEGNLSDGIRLGSWNTYFQLTNKFSIDYFSKVKHKKKVIGRDSWRLSLLYDYISIPSGNELQYGSFIVSVGKITRF